MPFDFVGRGLNLQDNINWKDTNQELPGKKIKKRSLYTCKYLTQNLKRANS